MTDEALLFELKFRCESYSVTSYDEKVNTLNARLSRLSERDARVAESPAWFKPMRGSHRDVAAEADRLNRTQLRSGYLDYFFYPEVAA